MVNKTWPLLLVLLLLEKECLETPLLRHFESTLLFAISWHPPSFQAPITAARDYLNSLLNGFQSLFYWIYLIYYLSTTAKINDLKAPSQILPAPVQSLPPACCIPCTAGRSDLSSLEPSVWLIPYTPLCSSKTEQPLCITQLPNSPSLGNLSYPKCL